MIEGDPDISPGSFRLVCGVSCQRWYNNSPCRPDKRISCSTFPFRVAQLPASDGSEAIRPRQRHQAHREYEGKKFLKKKEKFPSAQFACIILVVT